jgi:hypothetical protein
MVKPPGNTRSRGRPATAHDYLVVDKIAGRSAAHSRALSGGRLAVDGNRLVIIRPGEEPRKLPVYRGYAHPDDWAKVVAAITQGGSRH